MISTYLRLSYLVVHRQVANFMTQSLDVSRASYQHLATTKHAGCVRVFGPEQTTRLLALPQKGESLPMPKAN